MNTTTVNKIQDIEEFSKLFKINIPINQHFEYYISTLSKTLEYSDIYKIVNDFAELEQYAISKGYKGVKSYKLDYALPTLVKYLTESKTYKQIQEKVINGNFFSKDLVKESAGKYWFLSIDISKANYNSFKYMDVDGELEDSWDDLCRKFDIHPILASSKSFRQIVFGNTNPKRLQRIQHLLVMNGIEFLKKTIALSDDEICFVSHDEVVLRFRQDDVNWRKRFKAVMDNMSGLIDSMEEVPLKHTLYELDKLSKDIYLKTVYANDFAPLMKTLFGVPGNKFYKYFKLHILKGELDSKDLLFVNDGEIAKWMPDEDYIQTSYAPEGEYSLDEIKRQFPYFYELLSNEIPALTDAQKRKIVNISLGICRHCHNAGAGCQCWNDD